MPQELMTSNLDGKKVASISWCVPHEGFWKAENGEEGIFHYEYFGDRSENWIVIFKNNKEIIRYNVQYLDTIVWL